MKELSIKTIERFCIYRRFLSERANAGFDYIFSHDLAQFANVTPFQVRRDLMNMPQIGNPRKGYTIKSLLAGLTEILDGNGKQKLILVGIGNLGKAILSYFMGSLPNIAIVAAFDTDPEKVGRVYAGCRCYSTQEMAAIIKAEGARLGIITVPGTQAQSTADEMIAAGIEGIVNFAPSPLKVPGRITVEYNDITMSIEKMVCLSRLGSTVSTTEREKRE